MELKIPPPLVLLISGGLMWLLTRALPSLGWRSAYGMLGLLLALAGVALAASAIVVFRRHETTPHPMKPQETTTLVTSGVYRVTRNPMYLGLALVLTGWALYLANTAALLILPLFVAYITRFQIQPEERVLRGKFGAQFEEYAAKVRRWL